MWFWTNHIFWYRRLPVCARLIYWWLRHTIQLLLTCLYHFSILIFFFLYFLENKQDIRLCNVSPFFHSFPVLCHSMCAILSFTPHLFLSSLLILYFLEIPNMLRSIALCLTQKVFTGLLARIGTHEMSQRIIRASQTFLFRCRIITRLKIFLKLHIYWQIDTLLLLHTIAAS